MNRRKAVLGLFFTSTLTYSGFRIFDFITPSNLVELDSNKDLIDELAEIIIPRTDTPGAKDAQVGSFIIKFLKDCASTTTQNNFIRGLQNLKSTCRYSHNKSFLDCTLSEKIELLNKIEAAETPLNGVAGKIQKKLFGRSFIYTLKEYTARAYCTSYFGATACLAYQLVPGKRISCIELEPNQKSWATQ